MGDEIGEATHGEISWALVVVGHYKVFGFKRLEASEGLLGKGLM